MKAGFLLGLFLDPEDGGHMFLRNVGCLSTDYTALYPNSTLYCRRVHKSPPVLHARGQLNHVLNFMHCSPKIHVNAIFPSTSKLFKLFLRLRFSHQNLPLTCCMMIISESSSYEFCMGVNRKDTFTCCLEYYSFKHGDVADEFNMQIVIFCVLTPCSLVVAYSPERLQDHNLNNHRCVT
jgi:hypothetical protein